jgi:Kef-type K+ transport system membrane component KefB
VSLGTLALIGACGLAGPLLSVLGRGAVPVVVGEILAGILIGRSGLDAIDTGNATVVFLGDVGFLMLMFEAGMKVPLREEGATRESLVRGGGAALLVALLAAGAGPLVAAAGGAGHPAIYAVLIASGSAAIVLPVLEERSLSGPVVLALMAQVTVADIGATLAVPLVLAPGRAGETVAGALAVAACVLAIFALSRRLRGREEVHELRKLGKRRHWALDLRLVLTILFALGWLAQRTGASLLIAGFGAGLMVAAIGGPKRLSQEVLGVAGGFFIPLFFVLLGARLDVGGLFSDPAALALAGSLAALATAVHVLAAALMREPPAAGLVSVAQLGIPAAVVALGLPEGVITPTQATAILTAALVTVLVCSLGAARLHARLRSVAGRRPARAFPQAFDAPRR